MTEELIWRAHRSCMGHVLLRLQGCELRYGVVNGLADIGRYARRGRCLVEPFGLLRVVLRHRMLLLLHRLLLGLCVTLKGLCVCLPVRKRWLLPRRTLLLLRRYKLSSFWYVVCLLELHMRRCRLLALRWYVARALCIYKQLMEL